MAERIVLITGATGNLGRATARLFAEEGARLILVGSRPESLQEAFAGLDARHLRVAVDLTDKAATEAQIAAAEGETGRIDVLCALAGGFRMGETVPELAGAGWERMVAINVHTLLNAAHAVVPGMAARRYGKIVTIGANGALRGGARAGAYASAKSAVMRLSESLSAEMRGKGINVNCVLPSIIDTPDNRAAMPDADPGKWVRPEDLAAVIGFLCSDRAVAMHGALVPVVGLS